METVLLEPERYGLGPEQQLSDQLGNFTKDFDIPKLHAQLRMFHTMADASNRPTTASEALQLFRKQTGIVQTMMDQVIRFSCLIATIPASVASAERSFSVLRLIKTYTRTNMSQPRLSHLMLLYINRNLTKKLDPYTILNKFIDNNPRDRKQFFG